MGPYVNRNTDVGVVLDLMIHDIDIVMSIVRDKVVKINASGYPVFPGRRHCQCSAGFSNGCIANLTASRITRKKIRRMEVTQLDSFISIDYLEQELAVYKKLLLLFPIF